MFDVYAITPERSLAEIAASAERLLAAAPPGRVGVQLRAAHLPAAERDALARRLRALTRARGAALLLNAELALAMAVDADGVQLPERGPPVAEARARLGPAALIGASRHDLSGVLAAAREGASFVTLSPVFAVPGKGAALGLEGFAAIAGQSPIDVLALGGVDASSAGALIERGACGLAAIRGLLQSEQPDASLRVLLAAIDAARAAR